MKARWSFLAMRRGEMNVDPIQREFFTTEAQESLVAPLVRETIQNSLDAALPGRKVRVRFWLSSNAVVSAKDATKYFAGLWPHLKAKESGLRRLPVETADVPFLVIEDFDTRGLRGDPEQGLDQEVDGVKNDFFYFWRNVGRSGKREKDRGRWGLGKTVYPASSQINTFFGLTIPEGPVRRLLMGQSVLKGHQLGDQRHCPYGYFGLIQSDDFVGPITDDTTIAMFTKEFGLKRESETGLSVVVPFPQAEITVPAILEAVQREYFYAILSGSLEVTIGSGSDEIVLNDATLIPLLEESGEALRRELLPVAKLAEWACDEGQNAPVAVIDTSNAKAPKWNDNALSPESVVELRSKFEQGERLAFRIPLTVHVDSATPETSFFHVYLQQDLSLERHRPRFIREGIIISDAIKQKQREVFALVVIDDKPLATMLGDAENPAHTEWQRESEHFRDRYQYGPSVLSFVKNSVNDLVRLITRSKEEKDFSALQDIFFLPQPPDPNDKKKQDTPRPKPDHPSPVPPNIPDKKAKIRVGKIEGGFSVSPASEESEIPETIEIRAAYEVRRGNAINLYVSADFDMGKPPIQFSVENAALILAGENSLIIGNVKPEFKIEVRGFDPNRDLVVRAISKESVDAAEI